MKPDRKILEYGNRKNEILKLINKCELEKIRVKVSIQELWLKYLAREITLSDYKEKSNKILKNRSVDSWTKYLDECINYYKKDIKHVKHTNKSVRENLFKKKSHFSINY